jgi:aryl-alcohol dehydrogenase-like predicted oxidoreductase
MTFGRETSEDDSHQMLDRFVAIGGNFIDTADVYTAGASETIIGNWLKQQQRDELVVATKVRFPMGEVDYRTETMSYRSDTCHLW